MKTNQKKEDSSSPILVASSDMLGLCFIVITTLATLNIRNKTIIDELTSVAMVFFFASCVLSFFSVRKIISASKRYETVADYIFLCGLLTIFITAILLVNSVIK